MNEISQGNAGRNRSLSDRSCNDGIGAQGQVWAVLLDGPERLDDDTAIGQ